MRERGGRLNNGSPRRKRPASARRADRVKKPQIDARLLDPIFAADAGDPYMFQRNSIYVPPLPDAWPRPRGHGLHQRGTRQWRQKKQRERQGSRDGGLSASGFCAGGGGTGTGIEASQESADKRKRRVTASASRRLVGLAGGCRRRSSGYRHNSSTASDGKFLPAPIHMFSVS